MTQRANTAAYMSTRGLETFQTPFAFFINIFPQPIMQFVTLDVFTDTPFLGNPLAVVVVEAKDRATLEKTKDANTRQLIAKEFNLSETVFLYLRPGETLESPDRSSPEREIGIFTIEGELPFAGHPTIGTTYFLLRHLGWDFITTLLPRAGPIRITSSSAASSAGLLVTASIPYNTHLHSRTLRTLYELGDKQVRAQIEPALSDDEAIRAAELDAPIFSVVQGMTFLLVELPSLAHLGRVTTAKRLDLGNYVSLLDAGPWGHGFVARYYYVPTPRREEGDDGAIVVTTKTFRARMVELGFEDPATGSAASALSCHLSLVGGPGDGDEVRYQITQGVEMGRKSDIEVSVVVGADEQGARDIKEVRLSGTARVVMTGNIST